MCFTSVDGRWSIWCYDDGKDDLVCRLSAIHLLARSVREGDLACRTLRVVRDSRGFGKVWNAFEFNFRGVGMGSATAHAPAKRGRAQSLSHDIALGSHFLGAITKLRAVPTLSIALLGLRVAARSTHPDLLYCDDILWSVKVSLSSNNRVNELELAGSCLLTISINPPMSDGFSHRRASPLAFHERKESGSGPPSFVST